MSHSLSGTLYLSFMSSISASKPILFSKANLFLLANAWNTASSKSLISSALCGGLTQLTRDILCLVCGQKTSPTRHWSMKLLVVESCLRAPMSDSADDQPGFILIQVAPSGRKV